MWTPDIKSNRFPLSLEKLIFPLYSAEAFSLIMYALFCLALSLLFSLTKYRIFFINFNI